MRIPFTNYHIVKENGIILEETGEEIAGWDELIQAISRARRGGNSYDRRQSLRAVKRAALNLKVIRKCQVKLCQKQKPTLIVEVPNAVS